MQESLLIKLQAAGMQLFLKRDSCTCFLRHVIGEDFLEECIHRRSLFKIFFLRKESTNKSRSLFSQKSYMVDV